MMILVGANGSGKSNFLDSLRLVSDSLRTTMDHAIRDRGGIVEVRRRATGHPTYFGIRIDFDYPGASGSYAFQVAAVRGKDFRISHEDCEILLRGGGSVQQGELIPRVRYSVRDGVVVDRSDGLLLPAASPDRLLLVAASGDAAFRTLYDGLSGINVYNINPDAIRQLQTPDAGQLLRRDGSNVSSIIETLRREESTTKLRIEDYLSNIVPGVSRVERAGLGNYETVEFHQAVAGAAAPWAFQATSVSDGTLRALGVLTALFSGNAGLQSPIGIEEPESALHPAAARLLLDALRDASERRQVIVTSHSPDLLDNESIAPDEIIAVTATAGQTTLGRLDRTARTALENSLFTPGELLRVNQLLPEGSPAPQMDLFR